MAARSRTPPAKRFVKFQLDDVPVRKYDSVDSIMDRIDTELHTLKPAQVNSSLLSIRCSIPSSLLYQFDWEIVCEYVDLFACIPN